MHDLTDEAALRRLGERLTQRRLQRNLSQAELAEQAGISRRTLVRLEGGQSTQLANFVRVLRALDLLGDLDQVVPPTPPSPLELLRNEGRRRQRASGRRVAEDEVAEEPWSWDDEGSAAPRKDDADADDDASGDGE